MKPRGIHTSIVFVFVMAGVGLYGAARAAATALDDYVAAPDPSYRWGLVRTINGIGYRAYVIDMTSQTWRSPGEVDRTRWQHWLTVIRPTAATRSTAMLWINGGSNGESAPTSADSMLASLALATNTVVADLRMVPNQPLRFADEADPRYVTGGRYEDALIAYTWDKFLRTGDDRWPARLPMTKAAVRAMDTVQAFCASPTGGGLAITHFMVAGGSKRGWTTWTTAAVDPRVVAIAPIVIDVVNVEVSMHHHFAAYGFWAPAVQDYVDMDIMGWFGTPQMAALMEIEDPYTYRARYTMPKYVLNATGDQFFLPDSSQFYFDDLPGTKHLRYVPNTDHSLSGSDAITSLQVYCQAILAGASLPRFSWTLEADGSIRVQTVDAPTEVRLWRATNPTARDFRKEVIGAAYTSSILTDHGGGVYVGQVPVPPAGWTAFFVELTYASGGPSPFKFTTQVRVVPDVLPYAADRDRDADIDLADFAAFEACFNGPNRPVGGSPVCRYADFDSDGDADLADFAVFQACFNGPNRPPACAG